MSRQSLVQRVLSDWLRETDATWPNGKTSPEALLEFLGRASTRRWTRIIALTLMLLWLVGLPLVVLDGGTRAADRWVDFLPQVLLMLLPCWLIHTISSAVELTRRRSIGEAR